MHEEILFIGLIALAAITVFEVTSIAVRAQPAVRIGRATNSNFHQRRNDVRPEAAPAEG